MRSVNVVLVSAAGLLAVIAWLLAPQPPPPPSPSPPTSPPPHAPLLCSDGLPYEPHLSLNDFVTKYKVTPPPLRSHARSHVSQGRRPVVFAREITAHALEATRLEQLLHTYGFEMVTLASSNSFSYSKRQLSLREYVEEHMQPQAPSALANETWYMFGDTRGGRWQQVRAGMYGLHVVSLACSCLIRCPPRPWTASSTLQPSHSAWLRC